MHKKLTIILLIVLSLTLPLHAEGSSPVIEIHRENLSENGGPDIADDLLWAISDYWEFPAAVSGEGTEGGFSFDSGTGFFISPEHIVTNAHVVEDFPDDILMNEDGKETECRLVWLDPEEDLAVLRTKRRSAPFFRVAPDEGAKPAEPVLVMGYPLSDLLGGEIRITNGIVNALSGISGDRDYIQISAPIQPGNSGGPVMNGSLEVIGIASESLEGDDTQNLNFALKSGVIRRNAGSFIPGYGRYVSSVEEAIAATVEIYAGSRTGYGPPSEAPYTVFYEWEEEPCEDGVWIDCFLIALDMTDPGYPEAGAVSFSGLTSASYDNTLIYLTSELIDRILDYEESCM